MKSPSPDLCVCDDISLAKLEYAMGSLELTRTASEVQSSLMTLLGPACEYWSFLRNLRKQQSAMNGSQFRLQAVKQLFYVSFEWSEMAQSISFSEFPHREICASFPSTLSTRHIQLHLRAHGRLATATYNNRHVEGMSSR